MGRRRGGDKPEATSWKREAEEKMENGRLGRRVEIRNRKSEIGNALGRMPNPVRSASAGSGQRLASGEMVD
jgi:hypothetical protein